MNYMRIVGTLTVCVVSAVLLAECPIDRIVVNGQVEHAPPNATVKVQLIYPKDRIGESGDVTVQDGRFQIPVLFITQSRSPFLNGSIPSQKCNRKPKSVTVALIANDQEYDRVSLDMEKDFKKIGASDAWRSSDYALRSEVLLQGPNPK